MVFQEKLTGGRKEGLLGSGGLEGGRLICGACGVEGADDAGLGTVGDA